jgi:flagellar basal-body rod protein FlgC
MGFFGTFDISASGMTAQRVRMDTISQNIANVNTTRTENGTPYRRKTVLFEEKQFETPFSELLNQSSKEKISSQTGGVRVTKIIEDQKPFKRIYDPGHPDADAQGYVSMPNVDTVIEMVDMISATRAYEANVTAINASKGMMMKALEIGR